MSFGGILAQALAGGTAAIGKQAGDDIEAQRKADLMRQQADIAEQTEMRLMELRKRNARDQTLWETTGEGGAAKLDLARRTGEQANDIAIKGKVAEATNPELLAAEDAKFDADLKRKIKAGKELLPLEIDRAMKLAAADAGTRAKYREKKPTLADELAEVEAVMGVKFTSEQRQQFALAKAGLNKGRDPELDTQTVTEEKINPDGTTTKVVRKEVRKPGNGTAAAPGAPAVGTEVNGYVFKGGDPNDKKNWTPKAAAKPGMLSGPGKVPDDSNDRTIKRVATGYGTAYYRYAGKSYLTQQAAEAAKAEWDGISADDYFKTPD